MIGERMSQKYVELRLSDAVATARAKLDENPGFVAVIFDDKNRPVTIVTSGNLADFNAPDDRPLSEIAGRLPPGVMTDAAITMEDFVSSLEFTAFDAGAHGAMVFNTGRLAGVLTDATITQYLRSEFEPAGETRGQPTDSRLPGHIVNKPIIMYCDEFNHRNELDYYNRRKPPQCQVKTPYPHPVRKE